MSEVCAGSHCTWPIFHRVYNSNERSQNHTGLYDSIRSGTLGIGTSETDPRFEPSNFLSQEPIKRKPLICGKIPVGQVWCHMPLVALLYAEPF